MQSLISGVHSAHLSNGSLDTLMQLLLIVFWFYWWILTKFLGVTVVYKPLVLLCK